jgi:two-component system phosphate regulon sensor histidine kinase PhoR
MIWISVAVCLVSLIAMLYFANRAASLSRALQAHNATCNVNLETTYRNYQRAEGRWLALHEEYDTLMASSEAGMLILDSADIIQRANLAARHLFGMPPQDPVGKSLLQATLSNELNMLVRAAREEKCLQRREIRAPGAGGGSLIVSVAPVIGEGEGGSHCVVIAHDVTELRRLETIRRDFVANVSHELRTPLASIRAMAETLQDGALQDHAVADHFLSTINTEAQRLTRISEDLLILSQAESRLPEKSPFALSEIIEEVVARFQPQAEKAGLSLCSNIEPDLEVLANHDQIEQVIVNLIDNGLKYTPSGGQVRVTAERGPDSVAVHISDTGIGIMSQDLPRIFERFYRVDKARSRQSGGTGLGLSIVKHIVEAHGGQVTVESEYNRGSTFTITIPTAARSGGLLVSTDQNLNPGTTDPCASVSSPVAQP